MYFNYLIYYSNLYFRIIVKSGKSSNLVNSNLDSENKIQFSDHHDNSSSNIRNSPTKNAIIMCGPNGCSIEQLCKTVKLI